MSGLIQDSWIPKSILFLQSACYATVGRRIYWNPWGLEPLLWNKRSRYSEKPAHGNEE